MSFRAEGVAPKTLDDDFVVDENDDDDGFGRILFAKPEGGELLDQTPLNFGKANCQRRKTLTITVERISEDCLFRDITTQTGKLHNYDN